MNKGVLLCGNLKKIEDIVRSDLAFLGYSTQLRNLAYLIQLRDYLQGIYDSYSIDRGLGKMYLYNLLRINADIIEAYMFCFGKRAGFEIRRGRVDGKATKYINLLKSKGVLKKTLAKKLQTIINKRNDFHPARQVNLHVFVEQEILENSSAVVNELHDVFKGILWDDLEAKFASDTETPCSFCSSGLVDFGDVCPYCHKVCMNS